MFTSYALYYPIVRRFYSSLLLFFVVLYRYSTPGIVASLILRSPQQVAESENHRELSPLALYVPISTIVLLLGLLLQQEKYLRQKSKFIIAADATVTTTDNNRCKSLSIDTLCTNNTSNTTSDNDDDDEEQQQRQQQQRTFAPFVEGDDEAAPLLS